MSDYETANMKAARKLAERKARVLIVRQNIGTILLLIGVLSICGGIYVLAGTGWAILAVGVSLAITGVLIEIDQGSPNGDRGEAGRSSR